MTIELKIPFIGGPAHGMVKELFFEDKVEKELIKPAVGVCAVKNWDSSVVQIKRRFPEPNLANRHDEYRYDLKQISTGPDAQYVYQWEKIKIYTEGGEDHKPDNRAKEGGKSF